MNPPPREVFIIAGELSGDIIGAMLIKRLRKADPGLVMTAFGGERMEEAGANVLVNLVRDFAIIGIVEVITKYGKIRELFRIATEYLTEHRPALLIVIDYPGFNLRMAERAHRLGIPVVYYVTPQVWAWHKSRVKKLRAFVKKALVILPFEESFLRDAGVDAEFVGSPWLDMMKLTMSREEVLTHFGLDAARPVIGLLPGSRRKEVEALLPTMLEAAEIIQRELPGAQFVLPRASTVRPEIIEHLMTMAQVEVKIVDAFRYNVRAAMDFALVASGTATLETGLLGTPMAILYRMNWLSWQIGSRLLSVPYVGLINLVAGKLVVPELLQDQCTGPAVAEKALAILRNPEEMARVRGELAVVKEKMGGPGASQRAADHIMALLDGAGPRGNAVGNAAG